MLEAAERHRDVTAVPAVDPDEAGADLAGGAMGERNVLRPKPGGEAVVGVVSTKVFNFFLDCENRDSAPPPKTNLRLKPKEGVA